jgi:hypothetical protein
MKRRFPVKKRGPERKAAVCEALELTVPPFLYRTYSKTIPLQELILNKKGTSPSILTFPVRV